MTRKKLDLEREVGRMADLGRRFDAGELTEPERRQFWWRAQRLRPYLVVLERKHGLNLDEMRRAFDVLDEEMRKLQQAG